MQQQFLEINDLAQQLGFCYEHTRQLVKQAYNDGSGAVVKIGKRFRITNINDFINFQRGLECQEKKNILDLKKEMEYTTSMIIAKKNYAVTQLKLVVG